MTAIDIPGFKIADMVLWAITWSRDGAELERSPPTNVAWVRFPVPASNVG